MVEFLPLLKKNLIGKTIPHNGYFYEFRNVEVDESIFLFTVNTILPVKGGGFLLEKIYDDVGEIVDNIFAYIGKRFTISVHVFVDGEDVNSSYIPYESVVEVFEQANEKNDVFELKFKDKKLVVKTNYSPLINFKNTVQFDDGVGFIVLIDIISLTVNNNEIKPDMSTELKESIFVSYLSENLDNVSFENAMYEVLEPSFQFLDNENFYFNAYLRVNSYKGKKIKDSGVFANSEMFLSILKSF